MTPAARFRSDSLQARLSALTVLAMLVVIGGATALSWWLLGPPSFPAAIEASARQVAIARDLALRAGLAAQDGTIRDAPAPGPMLPPPSREMRDALAGHGIHDPVLVTPSPDGPWPLVSLELQPGRWLVVPIAVLPPSPANRHILVGWLCLMALGTTVVVVLAVRRMMAPLALLQGVAGAVTPDGEMPPLPRQAPAEVMAAVGAIERLAAALKGAMQSRMRMVAAAGHDLRTPITRMRLRAEFTEDEERGAWLNDLDELERIADSAIRLVREQVVPQASEPVGLDRLVQDLAADLRGLGHRVTLGRMEPVTVQGRPLSLTRALRNLVINAATHGGGAELSLAAEGGQAIVCIADRGPGIPEALMGRIFEPFFRVDPARRPNLPGAGLGLAIAHEVIASAGGTITLSNRPEGGLMQRVTLPLASG